MTGIKFGNSEKPREKNPSETHGRWEKRIPREGYRIHKGTLCDLRGRERKHSRPVKERKWQVIELDAGKAGPCIMFAKERVEVKRNSKRKIRTGEEGADIVIVKG